jgi:hypothetical protein
MVMVDAWLRGSQTLADYADTLGVDVCTFLEWIVAYGQPSYSSGGFLFVFLIDYSLKRWEVLSRYAHTGDLPIDNNPVERSIRPVAIGKKNWLFVGSERSGQRTAILQSLIGTAKLNGIDPYAWLKNTLKCIPVWPNHRIDDLLPIQGWELRQTT